MVSMMILFQGVAIRLIINLSIYNFDIPGFYQLQLKACCFYISTTIDVSSEKISSSTPSKAPITDSSSPSSPLLLVFYGNG